MKMLASVKLSEHKYKTPEGYLICKDSIIARTGSQTYLKSEIYDDDSDEYIEINRSEKEVFNPKTIASFEGKPLTIEHPSESVNPSNFKNLAVGNVINVHKGDFEGQPVMYADIVVWDQEAIDLIESGEMQELSCGYDCDITDGPNPEQINIRGNHVALCEQGRAGIARIQDSKKSKKTWGIKAIEDSVTKGSLIQEFGKQGKQYKIQKIVGNVIYANNLVDNKLVLFKKDEENIEWATITKSEVRDSIKDYSCKERLKELETKKIKQGYLDDYEEEEYWYVKGVVESAEAERKYLNGELKDSKIPVKELLNLTDKKYGITLSHAIDDLKKYSEDSLLGDKRAIGILMKRFDLEKRDVIRALNYKFDGLELKDTFAPLYIIGLDEESTWLDENDKPTNDKSKAKKFNSQEEAESYMKTYCKGRVCKIHDSEEESFNPEKEKIIIENLLEKIPHGKIEESWGSLTIDFDEKNNMKKAAKKLIELYDIELFDEEGFYIAIYDKHENVKENELPEDIEDSWGSYDLKKGQESEEFKKYLRSRGLYFEPSENGNYIHFEVRNADEFVTQRAKDIKKHYSSFEDSYSRKFYIKAIESLNDKLKKLEKDELLDSNQKDYEIQKNKMKETLKSQIQKYEEKLNENKGN